VLERDVGGQHGRKLVFHTDVGAAWCARSRATMDEHEIQIDREALVRVFVAEAGENLCAMEQGLMALESRPDDGDLVHGLFRAAHTLKGSASLVGFDGCGTWPRAGALLERVRGKALQPGPALVTLLLRSVDVLRAAVPRRPPAGGATPELEAFRDRIHRAARRGGSPGRHGLGPQWGGRRAGRGAPHAAVDV